MSKAFHMPFPKDEQLQFQALKALIHKKHEIRINFSNSKAYRLLQLQLRNQSNGEIFSFAGNNNKDHYGKVLPKPYASRLISQEGLQSSKATKNKILLEVIHREKNRLVPFGQSQHPPLMRNSAMSRTYRRKKSTPVEQNHFFYQQNVLNKLSESHSNDKTLHYQGELTDPFQKTHQYKSSNTIEVLPSAKKIKKNSSSDFQQTNANCFTSHLRIKHILDNPLYVKTSEYQTIDSKQGHNMFDKGLLKDQLGCFLQQRKPAYTTSRRQRVISRPETKSNEQNHNHTKQMKKLSTKIEKQISCRPWSSNKNIEEQPQQQREGSPS